MKKNLKNIMQRAVLASVGLVTFVACNPEPDESDLYTFTGETIESFIAKDNTLTAFNYILSRVDFDKTMATYGSYTCFAPINEGVYAYCDSLYNDTEAAILHNGMVKPADATYGENDYASQPAEERLRWLSDSLCLNIAKYHITTTYRNLVSMTGSTTPIYTMLGRVIKISSETGQVVLGGKATIISSDNEAVNGLVHIVDHVVPRTDVSFPTLFERHEDEFSIFAEALEMTGLMDSILVESRGEMEFKQLYRKGISDASYTLYPSRGIGTTGKLECKEGYTIFAESNEVFKKNGINNINDLIAYANKVYADAPEWYDYLREKKMTVSTGDDYTERNNALNMFVAYHIVNAKMSDDWLVYEKGSNAYWNFAPDADPHDYYETMLPHTMLKIWEPHDVGTGKSLFINRYQTFNTLTNALASPGTNHQLEIRGIGITRRVNGQDASLEADNGWIHYIDGLLVYDKNVPKKVLNERMRVNCTSLFPELITNDLRSIATADNRIPWGDNSRHGIPAQYFKNMIHYNDNICLAYCVHGAWRCWESDQMQFWGTYDLAFKLPPVPSGTYEIRVVYAPLDYASFMQYYIGTSSRVSSMIPFGLPFDARIPVEDPRVGLTNPGEEDDMGVATDIAMHNRGFMRGPYSYCGHGEKGWTVTNNGRFEFGTGSYTIRYVLGRTDLYQGNENWLRIKCLEEGGASPVGLDFVEIVPISVVDNQQYAEDWY